MRHDQSVIIDIPLALNRQSPLQHQLRLVRYTAQLRALLDSPPNLCAECTADVLNSEIIDNYLWAVGELINGLFQLNSNNQNNLSKQVTNKDDFTGSAE